ncbi:ecdysis triggering hormone preproprotein [Aphis craccivora]|uniref:Ecdysis triggering hormone preproprotein n=1 Tax=Aphis craccivora TaxID=307492 RepID=A0A6G0YL38_APHCR|nr:ecdysis triggering hormone preproprotein [Aphis craccivora]
MSGNLTIIGLVCLQILRVMSINEYPDKKVQNIWLTDMDDRQAASRIERSDQFETASDVIMKDASVYPKIVRRGFAGEEFFLKASKSVPRIGRRNNDIQESPKRSLSKDQVNMVEYWPYLQPNDINDLTRKHDFDLPYNCQQLDAKTIFLVDMYNFVCNDQFYCCAPAKRTIANSPNANSL